MSEVGTGNANKIDLSRLARFLLATLGSGMKKNLMTGVDSKAKLDIVAPVLAMDSLAQPL